MPQTSHSKTKNPYGNQAVLNEISEMACDRMDSYMDYFGLDLRQYGKRYIGRCPVHGSRNNSSVNIYPDGYAVRGLWECFSNRCERHFPRTLIGFTRGLMSHDAFGWTAEGDKTIGHVDTVNELCKFLGVKIEDVKVDPKKIERRKFLRTAEILSPTGRPTYELCTTEEFHKLNTVPSPYYVSRGYEDRTLQTFMVGQNHLTGRTDIPIFDVFGKSILGVLSRSQWEECQKCSFNHDPSTPCSSTFGRELLRWDVQPDGFVDKQHLYGFWRSRDLITRSKCVVLVEGAGDVWRLWEAGIQNAVGIMGSKFTDAQSILLEECSPSNIILMTDNDDAGNRVAEEITKGVWRRLARITRLAPEAKDLGMMSSKDVERLYRKTITGLMK